MVNTNITLARVDSVMYQNQLILAVQNLQLSTARFVANQPLNTIKCHICNCLIHHVCSGIPADVMGVFLDIVDNTGWVCLNCRTDHRLKIESLQTALAHVTEKLSDVLMNITVQDANISRTHEELFLHIAIMMLLFLKLL